jgi:tetratricopeptide (TPR) repeat protein
MLIVHSYGDTGRALLPSFQHVLKPYNALSGHLCPSMKRRLVAALLSASRFLDQDWKISKICLAKSILRSLEPDAETVYLERCAAQRSMFLSREPQNYSNTSYRNFVPMDQRSNAQRGEMVIFYVQSLIACNQLSRAMSELRNFRAFESLASRQETLVLQRIDLYIARVHQLRGEFEKAQKCFLQVPDERQETSISCWRTSRLADIYCELGRADKAEEVTKSALDFLKKWNWDVLPKATRLKLSLADAYLHQNKFTEAEMIYLELNETHRMMDNFSDNAQAEVVRTLVGLARRFHLERCWPRALEYWQDALTKVKQFHWRTEFAEVTISASLCHIYMETSNLEDARNHAEKAGKLRSQMPEHWCPLLGTQWPKLLLEWLPQTKGVRDGNANFLSPLLVDIFTFNPLHVKA